MTQPTILVCEDEYFIKQDICDHLRDVGYHVLESAEAETAQSIFLSGEKIHLLATDVVMPGDMDGLHLAMWVRQFYPSVRIMVLTGWHKHENVGKSFDDFVLKPYLVDEVVRRIMKLVPLQG